MENKALLYRSSPRWQFPAAFAAAIVIHVGMTLAAFREPEMPPVFTDAGPLAVDAEVPPNDPPAEPVLDESQPPALEPESDFTEAPPPPKRPSLRPPTRPIHKFSPGSGVVAYRRGKTTALSAPRPEYPYECRRARITGSGVALLTIDPGGRVTSAEIAQSTGNPTLDHAASSAFSRWLFRPNEFKSIRVPFTFTLMGAVY
jgi:protein TonB